MANRHPLLIKRNPNVVDDHELLELLVLLILPMLPSFCNVAWAFAPPFSLLLRAAIDAASICLCVC
jgi:hypothetical protein